MFREEALKLVSTLESDKSTWTRGEFSIEKNDMWHQLVFAGKIIWKQLSFEFFFYKIIVGYGYPDLPEGICDMSPIICNIPSQIYKRGVPPTPGKEILLTK